MLNLLANTGLSITDLIERSRQAGLERDFRAGESALGRQGALAQIAATGGENRVTQDTIGRIKAAAALEALTQKRADTAAENLREDTIVADRKERIAAAERAARLREATAPAEIRASSAADIEESRRESALDEINAQTQADILRANAAAAIQTDPITSIENEFFALAGTVRNRFESGIITAEEVAIELQLMQDNFLLENQTIAAQSPILREKLEEAILREAASATSPAAAAPTGPSFGFGGEDLNIFGQVRNRGTLRNLTEPAVIGVNALRDLLRSVEPAAPVAPEAPEDAARRAARKRSPGAQHRVFLEDAARRAARKRSPGAQHRVFLR
jgi:hypothetical protein